MKKRVAWAAYALSLLGLAACFYCQYRAGAYWAAAEQWLHWGTAALLSGWTSGVAGSLLWPFTYWRERAVWAVTYFCAYGLVWSLGGLV